MEDTPDSILWQNFKQGDVQSFGELARRHYAHLVNYGVQLVDDRNKIEDAIQDLFVYFWDKRYTLGDVENIKAYFFMSLRNRLLRDTEKLVREKNWLERLFSKSDFDNSVELDWINSETQNEHTKHLESVLGSLSLRQKEVIQLKFYEGLSNENIAEVMGISKQGVANLLVRTLKDARLVPYKISLFWIFISLQLLN